MEVALADPAGLLNSSPDGKMRRTVDVREDEHLDQKALTELVQVAVALNLTPKVKAKVS